MATEADDLAQTVAELLTEAGGPMILRQVTRGTYQPGQTRGPNTTADTTVTAVIRSQRMAQEGGSLVLASQLEAVVAAQGLIVVPSPKHQLLDGTLIYELSSVRPIKFQGLPVAYVCSVSGG